MKEIVEWGEGTGKREKRFLVRVTTFELSVKSLFTDNMSVNYVSLSCLSSGILREFNTEHGLSLIHI